MTFIGLFHNLRQIVGLHSQRRSSNFGLLGATGRFFLQFSHEVSLAQCPTFERRIGQCALLVRSQASLHQFGVSGLALKRGVAQRPKQRVGRDQTVHPLAQLVGLA